MSNLQHPTSSLSVLQCFHMPRQILTSGPGCLHQGVQSAGDQGVATQDDGAENAAQPPGPPPSIKRMAYLALRISLSTMLISHLRIVDKL